MLTPKHFACSWTQHWIRFVRDPVQKYTNLHFILIVEPSSEIKVLYTIIGVMGLFWVEVNTLVISHSLPYTNICQWACNQINVLW